MDDWRESFQVTEGKGTALSLCKSVQTRLSSLSLLGAPLGAFGCGSRKGSLWATACSVHLGVFGSAPTLQQSHKGASHPNLLFEDRSNSVCARGFWVPAGSSLLCCRARGGCSCPSVACLFSWAWSISGRRRWELRWLCWRVGGCVRKISFPTVHS